jgi:hypothetical protein
MDENWLGKTVLGFGWMSTGWEKLFFGFGWMSTGWEKPFLVFIWMSTDWLGKSLDEPVRLCDVAEVVIIHKMIWPYLATY